MVVQTKCSFILVDLAFFKNITITYISMIKKKITSVLTKSLNILTASSLIALSQSAAIAQELSWSEALSGGGEGDEITDWINKVALVIMAVFIMISIIMGSLAFKQLASDGNWKDFWSKIAGSIGMFVTPLVIYYLADL